MLLALGNNQDVIAKSSQACPPSIFPAEEETSLQRHAARANEGAVILKAGYWGGRIFGGVPNFLASFHWVIKIFLQNCKTSNEM